MNNNTGNNFTDNQLVDKVLGGDKIAFGSIIKNTERMVAQIIFKMISNSEDRKDIAQDVYLKVYKKLPTFQFQSKLSTWIAQISYNSCLDHLRRKKLLLPGDLDEGEETGKDTRNQNDTYNETEPGRFIFHKDLSSILKAEIEKLSPIYKTLITLYHNEEMSYEEIGQITGLPSGTVKSYLFRARRNLKKNLAINYKREDL